MRFINFLNVAKPGMKLRLPATKDALSDTPPVFFAEIYLLIYLLGIEVLLYPVFR